MNSAKVEEGKTAEKSDDKSAADVMESNASTPYVQIPYQPPSECLAVGGTPDFAVKHSSCVSTDIAIHRPEIVSCTVFGYENISGCL